MTHFEIQYRFEMDGGEVALFTVCIHPESLESISCAQDDPPEWTHLAFHQCDNCPLTDDAVPLCPAAVNMVGLVERFADLLSHDQAVVTVTTMDRTVSKTTTIQRGVCSLMGLLMATSGCPVTRFFKPMARFHLPFASTEETIWRATSTYLLAQYFTLQNGRQADVEFVGLAKIYENVQRVNQAFANRLRAACSHDSMVNAVILLDMFAKSMPAALDDSLDEIRYLFAPYLTSSRTQTIQS